MVSIASPRIEKQYSKHEEQYALTGFGMLRSLTLLADLKMQRYTRFRQVLVLQGLIPRHWQHDDIRAQYLSALFSSVGDAIAEATIMRLVGRGFAPLALSNHRFQPVIVTTPKRMLLLLY